MHAASEFKNMYTGVSDAVNAALSEISELNIDSAEAKEKLSGIQKNLLEIQSAFDKDLQFLEKNSEWDKFTVAFFGETNAGKSTIIESLRILLNEKEREKIIVKNNGNIKNIEQEFSHLFDKVMSGLDKLFENYNKEVTVVNQFLAQAKERVNEKNTEIKALESDLVKLKTELESGYRKKIQEILNEENKRVTNRAKTFWKVIAFGSMGVALASLSYLGYLGQFDFLLGL